MTFPKGTRMQAPLGERVGEEVYDLAVVGAGVNGVAIARDAALRGLRVIVIDKGDVGGGTSSWSSRLIHGGLRYLEHYDLRLVRESLRERERLLRLAPHLVRPIGFLIPHYPHNLRSPALVEMGMLAYDILSFDKSLPWHRPLSRRQALQRFPGANPDRLRGAALYHDAQATFPERLCVENLVSAVRAGTAFSMWTRAVAPRVQAGRVTGLDVEDVLTGDTAVVRARVVVNAAGPWVDALLAGYGVGEPPKRLIGGTKGSHVVVDAFPGSPRDVVYYEAEADNRLVLVMPWGGRVLIGTTDTRFDGDPDDVRADLDEVDYLLGETNRLIPQARLTRQSVLFTYSGVRPLPWTPPGTDAGSVTRNHHVVRHDDLPGLLSVVGGKLTTYRALAQEAVDAVYGQLGVKPPPCATARLPLPGARTASWAAFRERFLAKHADRPELAGRLLDTYGTRAAEIVTLTVRAPLLARPLGGRRDALAAEVMWALTQEHARTLGDVLLRRTMLGLDPGLGLDVAEAAAEVAASVQGWDRARVVSELAAYGKATDRLRAPVESEGQRTG